MSMVVLALGRSCGFDRLCWAYLHDELFQSPKDPPDQHYPAYGER